MALDLLTLEPQFISRNLKGKFTLVYGAPGCGKTTLASKFEKPLIASFEMGSNALNNVYVVPMKTWTDWKAYVKQLCGKNKDQIQEKFNTIVVDTVDETYKLAEKWLCTQNGVETLKKVAAYGQGYKMLDDEFMSPFRELAFNGYGLLFISHETEKPYKDDNGDEYNKIVPALPSRPFALINKMVDIITYIREVPVQVGENIERKRFMFFRSDERFLTKSRFKYIKPRVELDYRQFVDAIYEAIDKEVEASGGEATNAENPYLTLNYEDLMEEAKSIWGKVIQQDKTEVALDILRLEFGKPVRFSEILPEQTELLASSISKIKEILS